MSYYINPIWFYLIHLAESFRTILYGISITMVIGLAVYLILMLVEIYTDGYKYCMEGGRKLNEYGERLLGDTKTTTKRFLPLILIPLTLASLIPSKETCIQMMIAEQVTQENVTSVKEEVYDIVDYISEKLYNK